jgi:hypothetical protein
MPEALDCTFPIRQLHSFELLVPRGGPRTTFSCQTGDNFQTSSEGSNALVVGMSL